MSFLHRIDEFTPFNYHLAPVPPYICYGTLFYWNRCCLHRITKTAVIWSTSSWLLSGQHFTTNSLQL